MHFEAPLGLALFVCLAVAGFAQEPKSDGTKRILVLCTGNSARSQMAEGFLKSFSNNLQVFSAGTAPAPKINPYAIQVMKEVEVDISGGKPKSVSEFLGSSFDYVITVCDDADKNCPVFRGKVGKRLHIGFPDPARATGTDEEKLAVFRQVRDDIKRRFQALYESELRVGASASGS
jgi:arsenate reductase (thioredoxin)